MQLKLLWNLQEIDLSIQGIENDIENAPVKSGVEEKTAALNELKAKRDTGEAGLKADQKKMRELEMKTQKAIDDRKELYENMYGGKIGSVKELEQMQRKLDLLDADRRKYEDQIIALLESIEEQELELHSLNEQFDGDEKALKETEVKLGAELEFLKSRLAELQTQRAEKAAEIDSKMLEKYRILAEKHQGRPLARVDNDICGGCRVFISGALRGHLYNPEALVYCENCGRLLVLIDD